MGAGASTYCGEGAAWEPRPSIPSRPLLWTRSAIAWDRSRDGLQRGARVGARPEQPAMPYLSPAPERLTRGLAHLR